MLRPFLLVGVGGSGGKTLRVLHDDLLRRLHQAGWTAGMPRAWQFVHIDVPTVADGNDPDLPGQLPARDYQGLVAAGIDYRTIDTAMSNAAGSHSADALGGWRPDPNRVGVPASKGAGQFRALGRVITIAGLGQIRTALQKAQRELTGAEVVGELQAVTRQLGGTTTGPIHEPTVIVVSSIAGGTGSGATIDVCDAVRALGDKWADEIIGLLYAPDVFDYLPAEARQGVRPNSLAAVSELLSGYWNSDGPSDGTTELFSKYGVQLGAARRLGPRYPFLVGARNENVTYKTQNDIYRAMGRSLSSWVASEVLQDRLSAYTLTQWASTAQSVPDNLPLHIQGSETPFVAMGSARVGLGRDRFADYASEHLALTVVSRYLNRHDELRTRNDDRTDKQVIQDSADDLFGGFLSASGLDERGDDRNQIVNALTPESLRGDLKTVYTEILAKVADSIPEKGMRASDVRRAIRNLLNDRRSAFQTSQLAKRAETGRGWVKEIQANLVAVTARSVAQNGAPVTVELLKRLSTEVRQVRDELVSEAEGKRRWAADVDQQVRGALDDADNVVILRTTDRLSDAVRRAVSTFAGEQEAEVRELAVQLIPDLTENLIDPLREALTYSSELLAGERSNSRDGVSSKMALWPRDEVIPERLRPAPNEFLLEPADDYPSILAELIKSTLGTASSGDARRAAEQQVLLGTDDTAGAEQLLIAIDTKWTPREHTLHESVMAAPSRAAFTVTASGERLLARADAWLRREGTAAGRYLAEGLRDFLDPEIAGPAEADKRLDRFEGQLIAALNTGAPLVSVNPAVLVQVHERSEISYSTSFSEIPLPDKSKARERFTRLLQTRGQWNESIAKAFGDGAGDFIDVFTVLSEPYQPVVFNSLMRPIASEWGAKSKTDAQRSEFWRWRRARPLTESLPFSPSILSSMVRGWFAASLIGQLTVTDDGVSVFAPAPVGKGGAQSAFPWPTLTSVKPAGPELLPALLESVNLAMLEVNTTESLAPMRPYERLLALGASAADGLPRELEDWIASGSNLSPDAPKSVDDWEARRAEALKKLEGLTRRFTEHFDAVSQRTELLDFPGSYELRHQILGALGDLTRGLSSFRPVTADEGFI